MFKQALGVTLKKIFDLDKVTFDTPSNANEQEVLFIEVESSKATIKDGAQIAMVTGRVRVFASLDKMPFGYFAKKIQEHPLDAKDLFFFEIEESAGTYRNISERTFGFVYFFNSQHNPALGTLDSVNITYEVQ